MSLGRMKYWRFFARTRPNPTRERVMVRGRWTECSRAFLGGAKSMPTRFGKR